MNPAFSNLGLMLIMMQVLRRLDLENPDILMYVRVGYVACLLSVFAICMFV